MKATFFYDELTGTVTSSFAVAETTAVQMRATVVSGSMVIASATVVPQDASDSIFSILILDEDGEPILDVNGQYIIGG